VAVAVVSWNQRDLLASCLRGLRADSDAGRAEVYVVDNASSDGSPDLVRSQFPWVDLIACRENLGFGHAVNLVAKRTSAPWIAAANDDVEPTPGALVRLLEIGESHQSAGAVVPRLLLHDGSTQHSVHPFPGPAVMAAFNLGLHRLSRRLGDRLCLAGAWDAEVPREVPWAIAAFMLIRRTAFEQVGGFDPRQWMYAEDLDLAWRLSAAGWRVRYEPAAAVRHVGGSASRKAFGATVVPRQMTASYTWMARRRGLAITLATALVSCMGAAARLAVYTPLAAVDARRFGPRRDQHRRWLRAHVRGLAEARR
jgi:N-acetylglucosaminyl-diphospho-decaprenol L-rhamnosyltransferase